MAGDLNIKLRIRASDEASRALAQVERGVRRTGQASEQAARTGISANQRLASAREGLGIRSERAIQREIQRTMAQYNRLARSGTASAREIARAQEAARNKVRELNAEMSRTSMGQRLGNFGRGVMGVGAGVMAGTMVMREPVRKAMSYDRELAMVANTAFSDRDVEGRIAGKKQLHEAVKSAVETGGGTKEEALSSLNALLASGMKAETAINLLPTLQKGATATGASPEDLAAITISALQNGIAEADIGKALDMAIAAGQAGQFELQDMARWLPQQMAAASQIGLKGLEGFEALLIANQQARVTAGTNDEAGNNLVNLLSKITSKETVERLEKYEYTDRKGKKRKINYLKSMEAYKNQGMNSLEAFGSIMSDVVGSDEGYKKLQARLKNAKKEDQAKILDEMTTMAEGTVIGQIISDRQALMALLAIRNNVQLGQAVKESINQSEGATDTSYQVVASTNDFKMEKAKAQFEFGQMEGLSGFNDALGTTAETLSEYMRKYPDLTTAVAGAGTGIAALGAAALSAAGAISLLGGKNGGIDIGGWGGKGKGTPAGGGKWGNAVKWGSRALGVVGTATMLTGSESEETKKAKADYALALYATEKGTITPEQARVLYEANKRSVEKYDNGGWFARLTMSENGVRKARQEMATYEAKQGLQAVGSASSFAGVATSVAQMVAQVGAIGSQQSAVNGVLAQYQADFNAFGHSLSEGIKAGLENQSHTIDNRITVELDGVAIAEKVSQVQFNFLNRGVA